MKFFDTHCHLNDDAYHDDLEEVIGRARQQGVGYILVPGYDLPSSVRAVELARQYEGVFAAVGVHPHDAVTYNPEVEKELRRLLAEEKVVAVGEIGLDYHYNHSPRERQQEIFRRQLALAEAADLPVIIHNRESHNDLFRLLQAAGENHRGVLHAYSGSKEMLRDFLALGLYISVGGPVTFKNARKLPEVVKAIPTCRLVLETDAPYLTPHPYRGRRNEPAYLVHTAGRVAEITGVSWEELAVSTTENAFRLFPRAAAAFPAGN
ncbi:MAG: TatD family hydrolase [Firmicutes bacterium]|nr:TatD family hydrolase [Bacillota bacterium]